MASWILVPCLVSLRNEFNVLAPSRKKDSDGSIGDTSHAASSSDHNPDETGTTPTRDADSIDEVHAIDVDSDLGKSGWTMQRAVNVIVDRHRSGVDDRLQNVIYNRRIASRSWGWAWREYHGPSPHDHHAHFSARYTSAQENDVRPWGLLTQEDPMPTAAEIADAVWAKAMPAPDGLKGSWTAGQYLASGRANGRGAWLTAQRVDQLLQALGKVISSDVRDGGLRDQALKAQLDALLAAASALPAQTATVVLAGLDVQAIAAAIPREMAGQVADELHRRLAS